MSALKIKKGDKVVVLSGKDKGKHGEVTQAMPKEGKVVVSGVNIATRHKKATQAKSARWPRTPFEAPLHVSKVAIEDPKTGKPTRVRFEIKDGKKVRVAVQAPDRRTLMADAKYKARMQKACMMTSIVKPR